jgi:cyclopropane fatty-acyl-phospholipid synthase-like methyltransferase
VQRFNLGNTDVEPRETLPFSQACENNKEAILAVLKTVLASSAHVLEVGSGTGQHSVYFAPHLPHLQWQTSDLDSNHTTIRAWHNAYPSTNLSLPLSLDLAKSDLPVSVTQPLPYDAIFTANTLHIITWPLVERLFALAGDTLPIYGKLIVYGPFNEKGRYTSDSNAQFDQLLQQRNAGSAIRDKEAVIALADSHYLTLVATHAMPANNQLLVFEKVAT